MELGLDMQAKLTITMWCKYFFSHSLIFAPQNPENMQPPNSQSSRENATPSSHSYTLAY